MANSGSLLYAIIGIVVMAFLVGIITNVNAPAQGGFATSGGYGSCGDGIVQKPNSVGFTEQCDGSNFGGANDIGTQTCLTLGYTYGVLTCTKECKFDTSGCVGRTRTTRACGNGLVEGTEQCDDGNTVSGDGCSSTCRVDRIIRRV